MKIYCKIHSTPEGEVLAACDKKLVGKTLREREINFSVSESFYREEEVTEQKIAELLEEHHNVNLVGEKCVGIAVKKGLINKTSVIRIAGVPHAQIFRV